MMLHIPGVLTPEQVKHFRQRLAAAEWIDGRASVGSQGAQVKRNRQIAEGSPLALELGDIIVKALARNPLFYSAAFRISCTMCSRVGIFGEWMSYTPGPISFG